MKALEIKNLIKTYKGGVQALKGVSYDIEQGDFFALLGPNGAGKSTTINIIAHLVNKTSGTVRVFGYDVDTHAGEAKKMIGLVPQEFNCNIFETVLNIVVQQAGYYGIPRRIALERAEYYLKKLGLWEKRDAKSMTLSGGMKRKLMIVRALLHEPKLLILDEPTAGVDVETRREMWEFIKELNRQGTTIILTTHYLEEAEQLCKNIAIINNGEVIKNTTMKQLLAELSTESFVLDIREALTEPPKLKVATGYLLDDTTLHIEVPKGYSLTHVFMELHEQGVEVVSLRNKSNRLEELFISLTTAA